MLQPKKSKHAKQFRGKMKGTSSRGATLSFGDYGLKSLGRGWVTATQLEAARKIMAHYTKRIGKIWIRVFPDKSVTAKGTVGMGSGKGEIDRYVVVITPGRIIFELAGVERAIAARAMEIAAGKLPLKTKFVSRN
ncbi:50S ribosomal protein L16 [Candidatus Shapirobacteria bacterium CG09_land_8_20_14_0_10_47_13]|uniref:50S ribosomal protein L16 n=1 Tax=Candidatus Shapirobacteria bacterium CG09_land_8_20_14_0_10_47_13 TaxID=1974481 RepID=A0A2H0WN62_9BACT|nr:MAG: 50S ribosomal protein L16 [Candidatus Shapirobacteria bacterium CG09_land_8_20_14_0_10_47_13]